MDDSRTALAINELKSKAALAAFFIRNHSAPL